MAISSFKSQLTAIHDREHACLTKIRELEQVLFTEKARISEPEDELGISQAELDAERRARIQAKEFLDT